MHRFDSSRLTLTAALLSLCSPCLFAQNALMGTRFGGAQDGTGLDIAAIPGGGFFVCGQSEASGTSGHVFDVNDTTGAPTVTIPSFSNYRDEAFLARFDNDGNLQWAALGSGAGRADSLDALAVYGDNSVVAVGRHDYTTPSSAPNQDMTWTNTIGQLPRVIPTGYNRTGPFMVRLSSGGQFGVARRMLRSGSDAYANDVDVVEPVGAPASDRSIVIGGSHRGGTFGDINDPNPVTLTLGSTIGVSSSDAFLSCHDPDGNLRWIEVITGRAADAIVSVQAVPDGEGANAHTDLIISGNIPRRDVTEIDFFPSGSGPKFRLPFAPDPFNESCFIMRLDFEGNPSMHTPDFEIQWLLTFGGDGGSTTAPGHVVMDPAGRLYAVHSVPTDAETFPGSGVRERTPYKVWRRAAGGGPIGLRDGGLFSVGGRSRHVVLGIDPDLGQVQWDASIDGGSSLASRLAPQANGVIQVTNLTNTSTTNPLSIVGTRGSVPLPTGFPFTRTWRIPFDWEGNVAANEIRTDSVRTEAIAWSAEDVGSASTVERLFATGKSQPNSTIDDNAVPRSLAIPGAPNMYVYVGAFSADSRAVIAPYGLGCGSTDMGPVLGAGGRSLPVRGQIVELALQNAPPSTPVSLLIGFSRDNYAGLTLPFDLSLIGMNGCSLLASPDTSTGLATAADGTATARVPVPDNPVLVGARIYTQAVVVDPPANGLGLAASNAVELVIGG